MFFHGENTARWFDDFRPEVHDSDGLLLLFGHRRMALAAARQPARPCRSAASRWPNPRGFGLLQRDRDFATTRTSRPPEKRPSAVGRAEGRVGHGPRRARRDPHRRRTSTTTSSPTGCPSACSAAGHAARRSRTGDVVRRRPRRGRRAAARRRRAATAARRGRATASSSTSTASSSTRSRPTTCCARVVTVAGGDDDRRDRSTARGQEPVTGGWRLDFQVRPKQREPRRAARLPRQGRQRAHRDLVVRPDP